MNKPDDILNELFFCLNDESNELDELDEKVLYILIKEKLRYNVKDYNYFNVGYAVDFVINPNQVVFSSFFGPFGGVNINYETNEITPQTKVLYREAQINFDELIKGLDTMIMFDIFPLKSYKLINLSSSFKLSEKHNLGQLPFYVKLECRLDCLI